MNELKCLIVEDEPDWQERFQRACVLQGFRMEQLTIAADKARAIVHIEAEQPDIVILDLGIPSRSDQGDIDERNGRDVLQRVHESDRTNSTRTVVLIVSGRIDDYSQKRYEDDPLVVRAVNKDDIADALPKLVKRAEKLALRTFRDLKNHFPEILPAFDRLMSDSVRPSDAVADAYYIANAVLRDVGETVMGSTYPVNAGADEMFVRIQVLRGGLSRLPAGSTYHGKESPDIWLDGIVNQHFETIRNYCNCHRHNRDLVKTANHRCLLDINIPAEKTTLDELEKMERVALVLRPVVQDLLDWYLPWKRKRLTR